MLISAGKVLPRFMARPPSRSTGVTLQRRFMMLLTSVVGSRFSSADRGAKLPDAGANTGRVAGCPAIVAVPVTVTMPPATARRPLIPAVSSAPACQAQ